MLTATEHAVVIVIQLAEGTRRSGLVGECEVRKDRGNVPPNAARRAFPVVVRAPIDNCSKLGVLRCQRDQDVLHGVTLTGAAGATFDVFGCDRRVSIGVHPSQVTVTAFDGADRNPVPRLFIAATRNVNVDPCGRPLIVWVVAVERNVRGGRPTPPSNGVTT